MIQVLVKHRDGHQHTTVLHLQSTRGVILHQLVPRHIDELLHAELGKCKIIANLRGK